MKIRGYVSYIFYPKSGLDPHKPIQRAGFRIKSETYGQISCFGTIPYFSVGDYLELDGEWEGESQQTFQVNIGMRVHDDELGATSLILYLFGKKTGVKVLSGFENDAMKAIELFKNHQDLFIAKATKVKGIKEKTISKAYDKWKDYMGIDVIFAKFQKYGMKISQALQLYAQWGNHTLDKLEENPYRMQETSLPFDLIDKIALQCYGLSENDERRIYAGAVFALAEVQKLGHCYIRLNKGNKDAPDLKSIIQKRLNLSNEVLIDEQLLKLFDQKKLICEKHRMRRIVYFPKTCKAEKTLADKIYSLSMRHNEYAQDKIVTLLNKYEKEHFVLADKQKEAVIRSLRNQFSVITGPPGSGKTTVVDAIVSILEELNPKIKIQMCSPTGKAAQRIKESTGKESSTIHRLLRYNPHENEFTYNASNPLPCDVLIVDEFSMVGLLLANQLFEALSSKCHVILIGDEDQLPSIEPGKVLEDILSIDWIPKTILNKIYRQKEGSAILTDALAIKNEDMQAIAAFQDAKDVHFHEQLDQEDLQEAIIEKYEESLQRVGVENVCILTPMNKGPLGTDALNEIIQNQLHPYEEGKPEIHYGKRVFRKHDRVIQLQNEEDEGVFNGDVGTIKEIILGNRETGDRDTIIVDFGNDLEVTYHRDRFDKIKLAYSITIHKSQGSEYKQVIMILHPTHRFMLRKKLVYTGWTRAKENLDIFGSKKLISYSITNQDIERNTRLKYWLNRAKGD